MNYSNIKFYDIANGVGVRTSLFVSGCTRRCPGCFNSETWSFDAGKPFTYNTLNDVLESLKSKYIDGLTILGGEPLELANVKVVSDIIKDVREQYTNKKDIWVYTGYIWEELWKCNDPIYKDILTNIDVLVDGPFEESKKEILRFKGSSNQRIIDCTKSDKDHIVLWDDGEIFNNHDSYSGYER